MEIKRLRTVLSLACPALASLCLGLGWLPLRGWAVIVFLLALGAWVAARRWKATWSANLGLAVTTALAAVGLTAGAALIWMLPAVTLALAAWDLLLLDARLADNPPDADTRPLEKAHLASLALALALGLLAGLLGQMIRLQIPFIVMLALVALAYVTLERLLRSLRG